MNHTERSQILQMVESGQMSVQDAIGQMSSVDEPVVAPEPADAERWLRIRVTNLETGKGKVNVNLPLSWMKFGLAMGSRFVPELDDLDIDEMLTSLDQSTAGRIVEVEDIEDNQRVEIYIE
jgi:hypothetical protein